MSDGVERPWEMPFFRDRAAEREQFPEVDPWDRLTAQEQARIERLDAEDGAWWASQDARDSAEEGRAR
jgi:hypothetical protein